MKLVCPKCGQAAAAADINVQTGVLFCRRCEELFSLSAIALPDGFDIPENFSLDCPPAGAWCECNADGETVGATSRDLPGALGPLFIAVIGGCFARSAGAELLAENSRALAWWEMLFCLLVVAIGVCAAMVFLLKLFGRTTVTLGPEDGTAFTGIGAVGWRKGFRTAEIVRVIREIRFDNNRRPLWQVVLCRSDGGNIRCGMLLSQERQNYLRWSLIRLLEKRQRGDAGAAAGGRG